MKIERWSALALLSVSELLGMSLWFTASAVSPHFRDLWHLSPGQLGWLTTVVQLGFVAGTAIAAASNLADILPSRTLFSVAALFAALANAALVIAPTFASAIALRFATGLFLAGVYPPAMKMIATWFQAARGLAIGMIVGALTLGKAMPYLISSFESVDYRGVILLASAGAICGALLVALTYRDGPYAFTRRPFSWQLVPSVLAHRATRLAIAAYLGHMWELYAMWAALNLFFIDVLGAPTRSPAGVAASAGAITFACISLGSVGSVVAGMTADRFGRENVAIVAMMVSGACALSVGWLASASLTLIVPLCLIWGLTAVADSAQFSAVVTEVAPSHAVGTALTLQTSCGFLLTAVSIWCTLLIRARFGWGIAFSMLALGPAFGIFQMNTLRRLRARRAVIQ